MRNVKMPFILFFIAGMIPTAQELQQRSKLRGQIGMRNASKVDPNHACEPCDGVAGAVPEQYAKKFPTYEACIAAFDKKLEDAAKIAGDKPAPKPAAQPSAEIKKGDDGKPTNLPGGDGKLPAWPGTQPKP